MTNTEIRITNNTGITKNKLKNPSEISRYITLSQQCKYRRNYEIIALIVIKIAFIFFMQNLHFIFFSFNFFN